MLIEKFKHFVEDGLTGEFCRLYVSVNVRDKDKLYKNFLHWLIDNPNYNLSNVSSKIASIAAKPECKLTNKWLFDFDEDSALYNEFVEDIKLCDSEVKLESYKTPNGLCVISSRGFDTRNLDFTSKWKNVELKRDADRCLYWEKKSSSN